MKKYCCFRFLLILLLILGLVCPSWMTFAAQGDLVPHIDVLPGLTLEVGEEAFFTGEGTTYTPDPALLGKARYEWDFGDGYYLKFGQPTTSSTNSGMAAVHYFMTPGSHTVTLTVSVFNQFGSDGVTPTGSPIEVASTTVTVNVTGQAPMAGFQMLHAPFHTRLAQFITVTVPQSVYSQPTNRLTVSLMPEGGSATVLLDKTELHAEEKFLLEQRELAVGSYRLTAELKDAQGIVLSTCVEKFEKDYAYGSVPTVGIDEWNAICVNGAPKMIVTPHTRINTSIFNRYTTEFNAMSQIGYYNQAPNNDNYPALWTSYLNSCIQKSWMALGPVRGDYSYLKHPRDSSLNRMMEFVTAGENNSAQLMWNWWIKANDYSGITSKSILPPIFAAWTYATKEEDPNHPVAVSLDGKAYLPHYNTGATSYDLLNSSSLSGGKSAFYADILCMNGLFPMADRKTSGLFNKSRGIIDLYIQAIDNMKGWNGGLLPISACVEAESGVAVPVPTVDQILMEAWLAVIHGAKAISFSQSNTDNTYYSTMRDFSASMGVYESIILGPDNISQITDNSNVRYNRVDTMTRRQDEYTYLFAARLTEPDPITGETNHQPEPDSITTTFSVPWLQNGSVDVLDGLGQVTGTLSIANNQFTDTFGECDVRIYRIANQIENQPPVFNAIGNKKANANIKLRFTISATDPELAPLTYSAENLPDNATFDPKSRTFEWKPTSNQAGQYNVTFAVTDGVNTVEQTISIEVVTLVSISVANSKPIYYVGGTKLDFSKIDVIGTYSDGSTGEITITMDNISGFDASIPATGKIITVTVEGKTATFSIDIVTGVLTPDIDVLPGLTVEVGEEVLFSGGSTTYADTSLLKNGGRFEWDFGDGYVLKFNEPERNSGDAGMSAVHYFMSPGTYTVELTVSVYDPVGDVDNNKNPAPPIAVGITSVQVTVTGVAPMDGFELLRAPFNARLAQFITVMIPETVASVTTNRLVVTLTGEITGTNTVLLNKTGLSTEERFLLEQRNLPADNYRLITELKDASGNIISVWKEKFSKPYAGTPRVGINEWNAICLDGEPFFPVSMYQVNKANFSMYKQEDCFNSTNVMGYYAEGEATGYTPELWDDYVNASGEQGWMAIGPSRGAVNKPYPRNSSLDTIVSFVNATKADDPMLAWCYKDEPNLGGVFARVIPPGLAAWKYVTNQEDPKHPVLCNLYGFNWLPYYGAQGGYYNYSKSKDIFGGKRAFFTDILTSDIYPLEFRAHDAMYNDLDNGPIDLWVQSIDSFVNNNYNLVPNGIFIESAEIDPDRKTPGPTHSQVLMESWLAIAHGAKMINWFQFFEEDTRQYEAMREFNTAIETFGQIILGPDNVAQVTDNSNVRANRVDTLTRMDGDDTYLFAVRLTEPDPLTAEVNPEKVEGNHQAPGKKEPDFITTTFTVPGIVNGHADVLNASGEIIGALGVVNGQFTDVFGKEDYRIYRISEDSPEETVPVWFGVVDDMTVNVGSNLAFTVLATNLSGGPLTYSASNLPQGASFNPVSHLFSWTPQISQTGTYSITFTVTDGVNPPVAKTVEIHAVIGLESIAITTPPIKTTYRVKEELNLTGLVVTGTYSDGSTAVLFDIRNGNVSGFNSGVPVNGQILTVNYKYHAATFTVNIVR